MQTYKLTEYVLNKDLLQKSDGDIIIAGNDLVTTQGSQGTIQKLKNKILSFFYSLFAHKNWGGFFQSLVSKGMSSSLVNDASTVGKDQFTEEPEVTSVPKFNVTPLPESHQLWIESEVQLATDIDLSEIKLLADASIYDI